MDLNQWFEKAMSSKDYISSMKTNKAGLQQIYDNFTLPQDDNFFQKVQSQNLRVIVLTEDWCGDAMLNIPILLKLAEKTNMEVRMLLRDDNLELMDQYLTNGKSRSIPIFIFLDEQGNEVAKWGPRAEKVQQFVDEQREALPPQDAEDYEEKAKAMYTSIHDSFLERTDFIPEVYNSIKSVLQ